MMCNRSIVGAWEEFEIVKNEDRTISFKGNNGKYVSVSEDGYRVWCGKDEIGLNEKFTAYGIMKSIF